MPRGSDVYKSQQKGHPMTRFHDRYVTREEHVRELDAVQTAAAIDRWLTAACGLCAGFILGGVYVMALALNAGHR